MSITRKANLFSIYGKRKAGGSWLNDRSKSENPCNWTYHELKILLIPLPSDLPSLCRMLKAGYVAFTFVVADLTVSTCGCCLASLGCFTLLVVSLGKHQNFHSKSNFYCTVWNCTVHLHQARTLVTRWYDSVSFFVINDGFTR